ncbi:hypothetical protein D3C77_421980 [compost metagenome]
MQRLIHIRLRHSNVILETAWHRLPKRMDDPEGRITIFNIVHDNANRQQIINFIELLILCRHFLIYAVNMLWTAGQFSLHAHLIQLLLNAGDNVLNEFLSLRPLLVHQIGNAVILLRI